MHFNCLHEHPVAEDHVHGADGLQVDGEGVADASGPQAGVEQLRGYEEVPALRGQQEGLHQLLLDQLEVVTVDPPARGLSLPLLNIFWVTTSTFCGKYLIQIPLVKRRAGRLASGT